ncbi:hypothetical protein [Oscillatoria salina]|uniref:hypothetical protein n=1 Tax=Oscillatoria salina TaxID=331517 RepID=UPI0013B8492C|nr:hypothetical protein [Oscillatoria salina]MBZ8182047.1 hypothetical protein [Oscillatoria salina IIICB1]NET89804.1 hypothetical protein [Kamptonema sp. SIO1D9]
MKWSKYVLVLAIVTTFIATTKSGFSQEIQRLPQVPGIDISRVEYVPAEKNRSPQLEQAIIQNFGEGFSIAEFPIQYSYNTVDLNDDGYPEALVYVQNSIICGSRGCIALIFQGSAQGYRQLRYERITYGSLIVTPEKTNGWKDIIGPYYHCSDNFTTCYLIQKFNGIEYTSGQVISRRTITGKVYWLLDKFHQLQSSQSQ